MTTTADVVIVGGGCMGTSVAWHLAVRGVRDVVLIERAPVLGAGSTGRNAGGIRHQFSHEANVRLSIESIDLLTHFRERVGADLDVWQHGYLFLLSAADDRRAFERQVAMQRGLGVAVDWLDPDEARRLVPGLGIEGVTAATYCADDGIADPSGVTQGFAAAARRLGVTIRLDEDVTAVHVDRDRVVGVTTTRGRVDAPVVVNAAGPWAGVVGRLAGAALPIEPLRRHIFIAGPPREGWTGRVPERRTMVIDFASSFYFHREGAGVLFGIGDPGEQTGFDTTVRWEVLEQATPVATRRLPVLAEAPITRAWAGLYEMTPDAMPLIGPVGTPEGLFVIGGFAGHGFQHSPAAGRVLADVIVGRDAGIDLAAFSPGRFAEGRLQPELSVI